MFLEGLDDGGSEFGAAGFGELLSAALVTDSVSEELFLEPDGDAHGRFAFWVFLGVGGEPDFGPGQGFHLDGLWLRLGSEEACGPDEDWKDAEFH